MTLPDVMEESLIDFVFSGMMVNWNFGECVVESKRE